MLCLPSLMPKFWWEILCQNMQGWEGARGDTPETGILTTGEEIMPKFDWVVKMEVRGDVRWFL